MRAETALDSVQAVGLTGIGNNLDTLFPTLLCGTGKTKQNASGWVQLWLTEPGRALPWRCGHLKRPKGGYFPANALG